MHQPSRAIRHRPGHSLMELTVAMVAGAVLLAGLGSVMMIGSQVAYTPSAAVLRTKSADAVNQIAEELRYATIILQQSSQILEFVVADRNGDGTAEKIRYEWSGTAGDPLNKKINSAAAVAILDSIEAFDVSLLQTSTTTTFTTTTDSAEAVLLSNATSPSGLQRDINTSQFTAQQINPAAFTAAIPANAVSWNATKVQFYCDENSLDDGTLLVQLRATGDPNNGPTSNALGQQSVAESSLNSGWNTATFTSPVRGLGLHRRCAIVWAGYGIGDAAKFLYNDGAASGVLESNDGGASWTNMPSRQVFYRLYGTYTTPGSTYNVTRNYVSQVGLLLQASTQAHARIDARIPLGNLPELLSAHWRADFTDDPTTANSNGDSVADWALAGNGTFDTSSLIGGVWYANGALESRPLSDFTTTTIVEVRCRNTTVGGNGAVVRINTDRQGGQYAPLMVYVQRQSDGSQTLSLYGRTSDAATKLLVSRANLPSEFVRFRLTILPQNNVVNLSINDEVQGTYSYPTYAPASASDRYLTLYADTSQAEFDYVDVRVAN
ncbi:MAG: hypothetical protein L0228_14075 [Planctomycetes bacterium]|nr:hypothetical protein [Planctomycetota bacterium]